MVRKWRENGEIGATTGRGAHADTTKNNNVEPLLFRQAKELKAKSPPVVSLDQLQHVSLALALGPLLEGRGVLAHLLRVEPVPDGLDDPVEDLLCLSGDGVGAHEPAISKRAEGWPETEVYEKREKENGFVLR